MRARANHKPATSPPTPKAPEREHFTPPWATGKDSSSLQACAKSVSTLIRHIGQGAYRVAGFQRPWRWSDDQILALLDSLRCGYSVGSILVWERYRMAPAVARFGGLEVQSPHDNICLVIDGQQRMGALYAAARSGRFWFDLQRGTFVLGDAGAWRMPAGIALEWSINDLLDWSRGHAAQHGMSIDMLNDYGCAAITLLERAEVMIVTIPSRWDRERVVETYRRMNSTGTPVTTEELEAALASEVDG